MNSDKFNSGMFTLHSIAGCGFLICGAAMHIFAAAPAYAFWATIVISNMYFISAAHTMK